MVGVEDVETVPGAPLAGHTDRQSEPIQSDVPERAVVEAYGSVDAFVVDAVKYAAFT